jgi:hypothetical protein
MAELRAIAPRGRPWPAPAPVDPAALAAARGALLRALAGLDGRPGSIGIVVPPTDHRAAFSVQLGAGEAGPVAAAPGTAAYRLAAGAGIVLEGLHRPVDLLV